MRHWSERQGCCGRGSAPPFLLVRQVSASHHPTTLFSTSPISVRSRSVDFECKLGPRRRSAETLAALSFCAGSQSFERHRRGAARCCRRVRTRVRSRNPTPSIAANPSRSPLHSRRDNEASTQRCQTQPQPPQPLPRSDRRRHSKADSHRRHSVVMLHPVHLICPLSTSARRAPDSNRIFLPRPSASARATVRSVRSHSR